MGKKYLIYVDILGYKKKAVEIAEKSGLNEDFCREKILRNPLKERIDEIKATEFQGMSEIEGSDNYILSADTVEEVIEIVGEITRIKIPHKDFQWIPLEVGVGTTEIDEEIPVGLISRKKVITFLKEDIITPYRDYFKKKYEESVKETFVLFLEDFFNDLEPLDKEHCTPICHKEKSFYIANLEKIHERCKVFEFLRRIGFPGSKWYGRIDEVYVPPAEYSDIQKTLKEKRILFITGTQEYGKTYTAVRLLWEYFCRGYEVEWVKGEGEHQRDKVRKWLQDIGAKVKPHRIIYFEDPFGKTKYEKGESLEKEIGTIIENVKNVEDSYVIITSKEEVFKEFEKDNLSAVDIKKFEESLNLMKPSYDYKKRKEIVIKWAEEENCLWIQNKKLKRIVFEEIRDERNLTTPLKMRGFAVVTVKVNEEKILRENIKEKSEETAKAFTEEIRDMSQDKILFLSFLFVSRFRINFMKNIYEELVDELQLVDSWGFYDVLNWFKDDKIRVGEYIEFSHPSYSEALKYLIGEDGSFRRKDKEIFERKLLFKLAEKDETAMDVAGVVAHYFSELPEDVRNLLFILAEKDETAMDVVLLMGDAWAVARVVAQYFSELPEDVRNGLLFTLAEKDGAAGVVAKTVAQYFNRLPEDVRNGLLFTLAEKDGAAGVVAETVAQYFNRLPEDVRNLLFILAENDRAAGVVAETVAQYFNRLPEDVRNLLFILAEKDEIAGNVAMALIFNFNRLPEDVRNILFILAEKDETAKDVAMALIFNFNRLPEDVRKKLLPLFQKVSQFNWKL